MINSELKNLRAKEQTSGQLLLELLFSIAVAAVVLGVGSSLIIAGLRANQVSGERETAQGLVDETFEAVRAVGFERWKTLDDMSLGLGNLYYPAKDSDTGVSYKWVNQTNGGWPTSGVDITAVSALSPRNVWIGTSANEVWQWNGEAWTRIVADLGGAIRDIATVSDSEIWVVGDNGKVKKWNGSVWVDHSGTALTWDTNAIFGVSAPTSSRVWIVGDGGHVWRFDGVVWTQQTALDRWGTGTNLKSASALGDHVWIAGASGHVWHFDGNLTWTQHSSVGRWGSVVINSISFNSAGHIWIGGVNGEVWQWNGSAWVEHTGSWGSTEVKSISAFSRYSVAFVAGNQLWSYNGQAWDVFPSAWDTTLLKEISDRFSTELWVGGESGKLLEYNAAAWKVDNTVSPDTADDVSLNGIIYSRNFYLQNACRDNDTRDITEATDSETCSSGSWDPSTLKVTTSVSWGGNTLTSSEYITRWDNLTCLQTQWTLAVGDSVHTCPTTDYNTSTNIDFISSGGSLKILTPLVIGAGTLTSTVFDTTRLSSTGAAYNSIFWEGSSLEADDIVRLQIAASDSSGGPWNYYGDSPCSLGGWYTWTGIVSGTPKEINCSNSNVHNKRYFKYKIQLCTTLATCSSGGGPIGDDGPQVDNIIISWSP